MPNKKQKPVTVRRTSLEVNDLRKRMIVCKENLNKGAVTTFISLHPEFSPYKKASRVRLVFNLSIVDEDIIKKFEDLADLIQSETAKGNIGTIK